MSQMSSRRPESSTTATVSQVTDPGGAALPPADARPQYPRTSATASSSSRDSLSSLPDPPHGALSPDSLRAHRSPEQVPLFRFPLNDAINLFGGTCTCPIRPCAVHRTDALWLRSVP